MESQERTLRETGDGATTKSRGAIAWWRREGVLFYVIYSALFAAPWIAGAIAGWLGGDPSRRHALFITAMSFALPLSWAGAVRVWKILFWEKAPVTGTSGVQQWTAYGPSWEYRRKQKREPHSAR